MNACSFCGQRMVDVKMMITGPTVFICDECVELCNEILAEKKQTKLFSAAVRENVLRRAAIDLALKWFREVTPRTLPQEIDLWNALKTLAALQGAARAEPVCPQCGKKLARGPIGGGHFDWLECKHAP